MPKFVKFFDANRTKKTYPLYRRKPVETKIANSAAISDKVEVAIIQFNDENEKSYTFKQTYANPVAVVTPTQDNVFVYIDNITEQFLTLKTSYNFSGTVHLHVYES